jgi:hypothetical protein
VALTSVASESRRSRTHPSYPNTEATMRAVRPSSWHTRHTGAIIKGQRTRDEWASTRGCGARARARRDEDAGAKLVGSAARWLSQCRLSCGETAPCRAGTASSARATKPPEAATTQAPTRGTCGGAQNQNCAS